MFLTSFGLGIAAVTLTLNAVHGVAEQQSGVASALVNTAQQIGAALGLALFTTVAISAADDRLPGATHLLQAGPGAQHPEAVAQAAAALAHGYDTAFLAGAGMLLLAALLVATAVTTRHLQAAAGTHGPLPVH